MNERLIVLFSFRPLLVLYELKCLFWKVGMGLESIKCLERLWEMDHVRCFLSNRL